MRVALSLAVTTTLLLIGAVASEAVETTCQNIEPVFRAVAVDHNETSICGCAQRENGLTVSCSSSSVSHIFDALHALNNTRMASLTIRDSLVNILPVNMFEHVRPAQLHIDRCSLSLVRTNAIGSIGDELKVLSLRGNKLKRVESGMLGGLERLEELDLSANKISTIDADAFKDLAKLTELFINNNDISEIEDGTFENLTQLKTLSLIANKISRITKNTFNGLENLEILQLQDNEITDVDWTAFSKMKKLKSLNIGSNHLSTLELRGLEHLQKIIVNNNNIESLKAVKLRDLPSLSLLNMDRNRLTTIDSMDLAGLARSVRLESLSFASNNISQIGGRAFQHVKNIQALSLQNNHIESLSTNGAAYLASLKKLTHLQMSMNDLTVIRANELPKSLVTLAVDHNQLDKIEAGAFEGIALKRFYLNNNRLKFLYKNAFASFPPTTIEAFDVSWNSWQCVCKDPREWLPPWVEEAGEADVAEGPLGCLAIPKCGKNETEEASKEEVETSRSPWITVTASLLAVFSVVIMMAIVYLYVKDGTQPLTRAMRADSDLHKLIDNDPLSIVGDTSLLAPSLLVKKSTAPNVDKKRVRFEDN